MEKTMNKIIVVFALALATGCGTIPQLPPPEVEWIVDKGVDKFTDEKICHVTVGSLYTHQGVYTYMNHFYPFVEIVNGELSIGVKSGGKIQIPVGDIQLRVDKNKPWTITVSETPLKTAASNIPEVTAENKKVFEYAYNQAMKATAPYTSTTGKKAQAILKEMLDGNILIYRNLSLNQMESTAGEYKLDDSFRRALNTCNISL